MYLQWEPLLLYTKANDSGQFFLNVSMLSINWNSIYQCLRKNNGLDERKYIEVKF